MKKHDIFPCHLWSLNVDSYHDMKESFVEELYNAHNETPSVSISNRGGWQSPDLNHISESIPSLDLILSNIFEEVTSIFNRGFSISIQKMWFNINPPGSYNDTHSHPGCDYAGIFYAHVPKNSGNLVILSPNIHMEANYQYAISPTKPIPHEVITPEDGMFVMFPSHLHHSVEINNSMDDRISIAMNLKINTP